MHHTFSIYKPLEQENFKENMYFWYVQEECAFHT